VVLARKLKPQKRLSGRACVAKLRMCFKKPGVRMVDSRRLSYRWVVFTLKEFGPNQPPIVGAKIPAHNLSTSHIFKLDAALWVDGWQFICKAIDIGCCAANLIGKSRHRAAALELEIFFKRHLSSRSRFTKQFDHETGKRQLFGYFD
jgi:hypothetical protein